MKKVAIFACLPVLLASCSNQEFSDQKSPDATIRKYLITQNFDFDKERFSECFRGVSKSKVSSIFQTSKNCAVLSEKLKETFGDNYLEKYNMYGLKGSFSLGPIPTEQEIYSITIDDLKKEGARKYTYAGDEINIEKIGESWFVVEPYYWMDTSAKRLRDQCEEAITYIENHKQPESITIASLKNYMVHRSDESTYYVDLYKRDEKTIIDEIQVTPKFKQVYSIEAAKEVSLGFSTSLSPLHYPPESEWPMEINQLNGTASVSSVGGASTSFSPKNGLIEFEVVNLTDYSYGAVIYLAP